MVILMTKKDDPDKNIIGISNSIWSAEGYDFHEFERFIDDMERNYQRYRIVDGNVVRIPNDEYMMMYPGFD